MACGVVKIRQTCDQRMKESMVETPHGGRSMEDKARGERKALKCRSRDEKVSEKETEAISGKVQNGRMVIWTVKNQ